MSLQRASLELSVLSQASGEAGNGCAATRRDNGFGLVPDKPRACPTTGYAQAPVAVPQTPDNRAPNAPATRCTRLKFASGGLNALVMLSLWCGAATAAPTAAELERSTERAAVRHLIDRFELTGRRTPERDSALDEAARAIAQAALVSTADEAADIYTLTSAVSAAGGYDPLPRAMIVKGNVTGDALAAFLGRDDFSAEPTTHVGLAAAVSGKSLAICALLTYRRGQVLPFVRQVVPGPQGQLLCVTLDPSLGKPEAFFTRPSGAVERTPMPQAGDRRCVPVAFASAGRHTVEILARGAQGPVVVALFFVDAGAGPMAAPLLARKGHRDPPGTAADVLARINALRSSFALPALTTQPLLVKVANDYAARMAKDGFFAHVDPDGHDVRYRLEQAGYTYRHAAENLGQADTPLQAHFGIEHSPGHRMALLNEEAREIGIGIATDARGQTVLVEVLATPAAAAGPFPLRSAYAAIEAMRQKHQLKPLIREPTLESLALAHAQAALSLDQPKGKLPGTRLHERAFEAVTDARSAAVDVYVAENPEEISQSKNVLNAAYDRVGVGLLKGDSQTYGKNRYWVVVLFVSTQEAP